MTIKLKKYLLFAQNQFIHKIVIKILHNNIKIKIYYNTYIIIYL